MRQPIDTPARSAIDLLVRQVRARRFGSMPAPEQLRMDFELVRRQTDAAPRRRLLAARSAGAPAPKAAPRRRG